jgi:CDP-diacylglycerol---serine O-phosphatidyltransferase
VVNPFFGIINARFRCSDDWHGLTPVQSDEPFFRGLPIPANGIFWATMGLILEMPKYPELLQVLFSTRILLILGLFTSGMMVITLPMFSLKVKNLKLKDNWYRYIFLADCTYSDCYAECLRTWRLSVLAYIFLNIGFYLLGIRYK